MPNPFQDGIRLQRENAELRDDNKKLREALVDTEQYLSSDSKADWIVPEGQRDRNRKALSQTEPKEES